jgi:hypothetical protein
VLRLFVTAIACLLVGGGFGYLVSEYQFSRADVYQPTRSLSITSGTEIGSLPPGTYMNYRNLEHGEVEFYVFVKVPLDQAKAILKPATSDRYGGHRHLDAKL